MGDGAEDLALERILPPQPCGLGGKPLIALPSFLIIVFEMMILAAALGAVAAFQIASTRARRATGSIRNAAMIDARFLLLIETGGQPPERAAEVMVHAGAIRWTLA